MMNMDVLAAVTGVALRSEPMSELEEFAILFGGAILVGVISFLMMFVFKTPDGVQIGVPVVLVAVFVIGNFAVVSHMDGSVTAANVSAVQSAYGVKSLESADDDINGCNWLVPEGDSRPIKVRFKDSKGASRTGSISIDDSKRRAVLYVADNVEYGGAVPLSPQTTPKRSYSYSDSPVEGISHLGGVPGGDGLSR